MMVLFSVVALVGMITRDAALLNRAEREREQADRLREHHEKTLAETAAILDRMFSNIHLMIAYTDRDFNFLKVNQGYADGAGHPPEFFIGKNHFDLYPHEENERIFRRVVETGEPFVVFSKPFEYPDQPERGTTYWDWSLQPVKEPDGGGERADLFPDRRDGARPGGKTASAAGGAGDPAGEAGPPGADGGGIAHEVRNPLSGLNFSLGVAETLCEAAGNWNRRPGKSWSA